MSATLHLELSLPDNFRLAELLAFHGRDPQALAETVSEDGLRKGLVWRGQPAVLSLQCVAGTAHLALDIDGDPQPGDAAALERLALHWLGLTQDVAAFEQQHGDDPLLAPLLRRQSGLRVPQTATPFEALSWAVMGQQISVQAAVALRRKLIVAAGLRHSGGLHCFPDATRLAALGEAALHAAGCSASKAATLVALARAVDSGQLPLDTWLHAPPVAEIRQRLLAIKGVGPWTVNYALLRGFAHLDGSLHGDVAVRRNLQALLSQAAPVNERQAETWLAGYSPWRALLAAHLWAMGTLAA